MTAAVLGLFFAACTKTTSPDPPARHVQDATVALRAHETRGRWYTLQLPPGASEATVLAGDVFEAIYVLDPEEHVNLTFTRPTAGLRELREWKTAMLRVWKDRPSRSSFEVRLDDVPADLQVADTQLRWVFVADGYGGVILCGSEQPHDEGWLHGHCDPTVETIRLLHPLSD